MNWRRFCRTSSEGEEEHCGGTAEAAPVRDGADRQDVWRPGDHQTDAVHKVEHNITLAPGKLATGI